MYFRVMVITVVLVGSLLLSSCVTGDVFREIEPGMNKAEVIEILGRPDAYQLNGEYEAMKYANRLMSGWSWDRADYYVILKNDSVVEYGPGEVRTSQDRIVLIQVF